MSMTSRKSVMLLVVLLVVAGALWGIAAARNRPEQEPQVAVPKELTVEALKAQAEQPERMRDTMRGLRDREDLTDEQRQQARRNMREVWRSMMDERMDEYFAAPEDQKVAVLDRQIDEWQKAMERMRRDREERREEMDEGDRERRREEWREQMRERRRSATREQRKERSEGRSPDEMARRMAYFSAVRQRMTERGMDMPWGGRGGGPRGGGPRGGGP